MTENHYGKVQVKEMGPMRVACHKAVSATPEEDSIRQMNEWLAGKKLVGPIRKFGFDVEVKSEQKKAGLRGYEVWAVVPANVESSESFTIKDFAGGLYAVMRITDPFTDPFEVIPAGWKRLVEWAKASDEYNIDENPCLEEHVKVDGVDCLDIHLPVVRKRGQRTSQR